MNNEIKQELKDNARFFPRSVCFEKAFLEKLTEKYPEIKSIIADIVVKV